MSSCRVVVCDECSKILVVTREIEGQPQATAGKHWFENPDGERVRHVKSTAFRAAGEPDYRATPQELIDWGALQVSRGNVQPIAKRPAGVSLG